MISTLADLVGRKVTVKKCGLVLITTKCHESPFQSEVQIFRLMRRLPSIAVAVGTLAMTRRAVESRHLLPLSDVRSLRWL